MKTACVPSGLRYLVLPDAVTTASETIGAYTVSTQVDAHKKASEGTVVSVGDGERNLHGPHPLVCKYKSGDKLIYGQYSGYEQEFDGVKYIVLSESEILGQRVEIPL